MGAGVPQVMTWVCVFQQDSWPKKTAAGTWGNNQTRLYNGRVLDFVAIIMIFCFLFFKTKTNVDR
jgi:hypothetical protein